MLTSVDYPPDLPSPIGRELDRRDIDFIRRASREVIPQSRMDPDDAFGAGLLGYWKAVKDFDPERRVPWGAYARLRIRGAVLDEARRLDPIGRGDRRTFTRAAALIAAGHNTTEVSSRLGIDHSDLARLLAAGRSPVSLNKDAFRGVDGRFAAETTLLDALSDSSGMPHVQPLPWQNISSGASRDDGPWDLVLTTLVVSDAMQELDNQLPREAAIVKMLIYQDMTYEEVSTFFGVSINWIYQLRSRALELLAYLLPRSMFVT